MSFCKLRQGATAWREVDGEAIVLDLVASVYMNLNRSGTLMWVQLAVGTTQSDLVRVLVERFGIDRERARLDVEAFVTACRSRDLLDT